MGTTDPSLIRQSDRTSGCTQISSARTSDSGRIPRLDRDTSKQYVFTEDKTDTDDNNYRLSAEQLTFWQENGYLILPNIIDSAACTASCDAIWNTQVRRCKIRQAGISRNAYNMV
jgi:hypothetical protein